LAVIWAATKGFLDEVPLNKIEAFEEKLISDLNTRGRKLLDRINQEKAFSAKEEEELKKYVTVNLDQFKKI